MPIQIFKHVAMAGLFVLASPLGGIAQERQPWDRSDTATAGPGGSATSVPKARSRANDSYRPPDGSSGSLGTLNGSAPVPNSGRMPYLSGGSPDSFGSPPPVASRGPTYDPQSGSNQPPAGGWSPPVPPGPAGDGYRPPGADTYGAPTGGYASSDVYRPPAREGGYTGGPPSRSGGYGEPYTVPREDADAPYESGPRGRYADDAGPQDGSYSRGEILGTGHRFFGSVSQGLANAVEYVFQNAGRPNGYILGEDAGGAFVAGLRYGEGVLHTKDAGRHKVYWQGPSLGYDFGGEGSKTMVLVYNLRDPEEIFDRFGGVQGSAYLVGGISVQFQKSGDVLLAPIRSGLGLRLGANVGYLKYTRKPTWNPF